MASEALSDVNILDKSGTSSVFGRSGGVLILQMYQYELIDNKIKYYILKYNFYLKNN